MAELAGAYKIENLLTYADVSRVSVPSVNVLETAAQIDVSPGQVWSPNSNRPFWLEFWCKDADLTPTAGVVTPTYPVLIKKDASGTAYTAGITEILVGTVSGTKQRLTITARTATSITFSDTVDAETTVDAFYIPDRAGILALYFLTPDMVGSPGYRVLSASTNVLAHVNPWNKNTFVPFRSPIAWPEDTILDFRINAPWTVAWVDTAATPAALPISWCIPMTIEGRNAYAEDFYENYPQIPRT